MQPIKTHPPISLECKIATPTGETQITDTDSALSTPSKGTDLAGTSPADPAEVRKKKGEPCRTPPYRRLAATYFSTNERSIIGDVRLNFSVRNGKR